ncbi:MAG TPA: hypoxanthine-guanine phosphoribosyltransferase [Gammaproteobacteria bacterium]|jgi:hypoxanthine phosphoribosyltransferase
MGDPGIGSRSRLDEALDALRTAREVRSAAAMQAALDRMAAQISAKLGDSNPVFVAVMHGGVFAAVELSRRVTFPHEFDYVHLTRYKGALEGGEIDWIVRPRESLRGRAVLVVDDILDHGLTLAALLAELKALGVAALYSAVLVSKPKRRVGRRVEVDFIGTTIDEAYVFGCGMDYKGYWRGLPGLFEAAPP